MSATSNENDIWDDDLLGFKEIGHAFTNLIQSIDSGKVVSIEAGFGRGKTFFRKAWSRQLRAADEVVVEIDVQQSDHSGDPVITLLGALVDALPRNSGSKGEKALESAKKVATIGARALTRAIIKSGADEIFDALSDGAIDKLEDFDALDRLIKDIGGEMSKIAGELIASQMALERVRKEELPDQLEALRSTLAEGAPGSRVVVIIDELDRCHPEYAIAFLEAMKVVFGRSGFVFCLMVNAEYLESLARHRFGVAANDEKYLDKFVDIRLKLEPHGEAFKAAVHNLAIQLPLAIPFGEHDEFSMERAARLASDLAFECGLSMRKTERILSKVELALRCYSDRPLDAALLVFLAFKDENQKGVKESHLPRSKISPDYAREHAESTRDGVDHFAREGQRDHRLNQLVNENAQELLTLPADRYHNPEDINYKPWAKVLVALAPHYLPSHRSVLDGVAAVMVQKA